MSLGESTWAPRLHQQYHQTPLRQTRSCTNSPSKFASSIHSSPLATATNIPLHTPPATPPNIKTRPSSSVLHQHVEPQQPPPPAPPNDLQRIQRLLRRLRWKSTSLLCSYSRAAAAVHHAPNHAHDPLDFLSSPSSPNPTASDQALDASAAAESMFKVDFFEWYVLLERILVLLLELSGVSVSSSSSSTAPTGTLSRSKSVSNLTPNLQSSKYAPVPSFTYPHRFHAALLDSLATPANPLYPVLGHGEPFRYLGLAKEFRNRWKDADVPAAAAAAAVPEAGVAEARETRLLQQFDLPGLLSVLLRALEEGLRVAVAAAVAGRGGERGREREQLDDEVPWEAVGDPMEWE